MLKEMDWPALFATLVLIIAVREAAVWLMTQLNHPELGNLFGLFGLLIALLIWRRISHIPKRLVDANQHIMKESAFAFLPICAGSVMMLVHMGKEIPVFLLVLTLSTLLPLWVYAYLAKRWL